MAKKQIVRLTEGDLHRIIKESVNKVMTNEDYKPLGASYSDEHISDVKTKLLRQISNLLSFMNAYSDSILSTNMLDENTYNILYDLLAKIHESDLHRIVKESVEKILMESETDLYDTLARPNGKLDISNPYTWAKSPKNLKDMGYDENGMKNGKKYYDHLLNPNWRFNKQRSAGIDFALDAPSGDQKYIRADIANMQKKQSDADARWQKAADSRPLHRKGSLNREF